MTSLVRPTRIICLANSYKHTDRCIAGIDLETGKWVRPVSDLDDGRVPQKIRLIDGKEPELLDILCIPLSDTGPDFGIESENRLILPGKWLREEKASVTDVCRYCKNEKHILHSTDKFVSPKYLASLHPEKRITLQLVETEEFSVKPKPRDIGGDQWLGSLKAKNGAELNKVSVTDPIYIRKFKQGQKPQNHCLITVGLSMPWPQSGAEEPRCWKLIVGIIELD